MLLAAGHNWRPDHGLGKWTGALIAVVALHAGAVGAALITWQGVVPPTPPPAAIMIELMPTPAAPPAPRTLATSEPRQPEPIPEPQIELPIPEIDLTPPVFPKPEVVLPPPPQEKPKEVVEKPKEKPPEKPKEKPKDKPKPAVKVEKQPEPQVAEEPAPQSTQDASVAAAPVPPAPVAAAPSAADIARIANAKTNWQGMLLAHLEKHRKYPKRAKRRNEQGTSFLFIRMDRSGNVLSYALKRSSGYEALDEETLALIERAKPLPPLPTEMTEQFLEITVPVEFTLH
jgi:periplasmic protein TonB